MPLVEVAYTRHWYRDRAQMFGVTFPEFKQTCCVTGAHDRALINHCLRLGLVINIEARYLHAGCGAEPDLIPHLRAARALRRPLEDLLGVGALDDPHGCMVEGDAGLLVGRFRNTAGDSALVVCHWEDRNLRGSHTLPGHGKAEVHRLDGSVEPVSLPASLTIAPDELAVLVARAAPRNLEA